MLCKPTHKLLLKESLSPLSALSPSLQKQSIDIWLAVGTLQTFDTPLDALQPEQINPDNDKDLSEQPTKTIGQQIEPENNLPAMLDAAKERKGNVLFNDALNTFYLRLYGVGHVVEDHSESERGNLLLPHGLLFPISSKGSFIHHPTDRIAHTTVFVTPVVEHWLEREIAQWVHPMKDRSDNPLHHDAADIHGCGEMPNIKLKGQNRTVHPGTAKAFPASVPRLV